MRKCKNKNKNKYDIGGPIVSSNLNKIAPVSVTDDVLSTIEARQNLLKTMPIKTPNVSVYPLRNYSLGQTLTKAAPGIASSIAPTIGNAISGGYSSGVGDSISSIGTNIGGAISAVNPLLGAAVTVASNIVGGGVNTLFGSKENAQNISDIKTSTSDMNNTFVGGSDDEIAAQLAQQSFGKNYTANDLGKVGILASNAKYLNMVEDQKNARMGLKNRYTNAFENAEENELLTNLRSMAKGGPLHNHGALWDNGLIYINNGNTHEQNPNQGVQVGVDPKGTPNLVEEGETIFNDYVFSNRLKADGGLLDLVKLPKKYGNKTFADISKLLAKESEERPNDPISKRGFEDAITKLQAIHEIARQYDQAKEQVRQFARGGNLFVDGTEMDKVFKVNKTHDDAYWNNLYAPGSQFMNNRQAVLDNWDELKNNGSLQSYVDYINKGLVRGSKLTLDNFTTDVFKKMTSDKADGNAHDLSLLISGLPITENQEEANAVMPYLFPWSKTMPQLKLSNPFDEYKTPTKHRDLNSNGNQEFDIPTSNFIDYRKLGNLAELGFLANNIISDPDYTYANQLENVAKNAGNYERIYANPIGNKLTFNPMDINREVNRLSAENAATRRAAMNLAEGNRSAALAGILAADYNNQIAIGDAHTKAENADFSRRKEVEDFNSKINQINAQNALTAASSTQNARLKANELMSKYYADAAGARYNARQEKQKAIQSNITNIFDNLNAMTNDQINRDTAKWRMWTSGVKIPHKPAWWTNSEWQEYLIWWDEKHK